MSATWHFYGLGLQKLVTGSIDLDTDAFKVMLVDSSYTPNQDTHAFRSDVTGEVSGTGYTAGGQILTGVTMSYDATTNQVRVAWTDPVWTNASITAHGAVIYKSRGGAASADELLAYAINDVDVVSTAADFKLDLPVPTLYLTAS